MASLQTVFAILTSSRWIIQIIITVLVVQSLVAIWLSLGKANWRMRAAVNCCLMGSLVAIRAYLPAVVFCVAVVLTTATFSLVRLRTARFGVQERSATASWRVVLAGCLCALAVTFVLAGKASAALFAIGWHEQISAKILLACFTAIASMVLFQKLTAGFHRDTQDSVPTTDSVVRIQQALQTRRVYSLRDLLIGATLCAVAFAMIAYSLERSSEVNVSAMLGFSAFLACVNVLVSGVVVSATWRWRCVSLVALLAVMYAAGTLLEQPSVEWLTSFFTRPTATVTSAYWMLLPVGTVTLAMAVWMMHQARLVALHPFVPVEDIAHTPENKSTRTQRTFQIHSFAAAACFVSAVTIIATLGPLYQQMAGNLDFTETSPPDPVAYKRIIKELTAIHTLNPSTRSIKQLRASGLDEKADWLLESYAVIDQAITQETSFQAPPLTALETANARKSIWYKVDFDTLSRNLTRSWLAEIRSHSQKQPSNQLVMRTTHLMQFGSLVARTGSLAETLNATSAETAAQEELLAILDKLQPQQLRNLIETLHNIDTNRVPASTTINRDRVIMDRELTWHARIQCVNEIYAWDHNNLPGNAWSPGEESLVEAILRRDTACRMLMVHAAMLLYKNDLGVLPDDASLLTPAYLPELPTDPFSGELFLHRSAGDTYELYSQRRNPHGVVLPRDERIGNKLAGDKLTADKATHRYLWNLQETIAGVRHMTKK